VAAVDATTVGDEGCEGDVEQAASRKRQQQRAI
jgi:hypothetical protein